MSPRRIARWLGWGDDDRPVTSAAVAPATGSFEATWRTTVKRRVAIVLGVLAVWAVAIEARLVQLQVFQHEEMARLATHQQQSVIHPVALRGDITDRNGELLAYSVNAEMICADPTLIEDPDAAVKALCNAFRDCSAKEREDLAAQFKLDREFVFVRRSRQVTPDQVDRVRALKLKGIEIQADPARYYPNFELAAHVLGFVGSEDKGRAGVEAAFDDIVRGQAGSVLVQLDAKRKRMDTRVERAPVPGGTLELTIDSTLQYIAERELKVGVESNHAASGTALILDPLTGEILALANYPTFNPNSYQRFSDDDRRNRAVQDVYEPGSTFKIVTASAALEENILKPTTLIDTCPGFIKFPGRKAIHDDHPGCGVSSFEDIIVKSSNVGAIKTGLQVGAELMARYVRRFGFGQIVGNDFRGESGGIVWSPTNMDDSALGSMSMGYQVAVTPLQMALAAGAVANGGLLYEPHLVRAVIRDGQREPVAPKVVRRAINADTAATMTTIMEGVVQRGTATAAQLDRYTAAGKTGTAHKVTDGHYSEHEFNASFVGFAPSRRPVLTVIVVIDSPHGPSGYYGGHVAAPVFKRIMSAALQHLGVPPTVNPTAPVVVTTDAPIAVAPPATSLPTILPTLAEFGGHTLMPDVRGLSMRDAVRMLGRLGLSVRVLGDGVVFGQTPEAGDPLEPGGASVLQLRRATPDISGGGGSR